ncbi:probable G-protein coupled receptor 139 [Mytilus edulis]|uniref:G-protein coupled receptors family 1 profile domain-containing protein n=3 Tax=Mytilus TaxID=6548 RepID=A0A8B6HF58_MYTGA|nr:Hypothetical predicted protein [Mytilus galloprovincialis]
MLPYLDFLIRNHSKKMAGCLNRSLGNMTTEPPPDLSPQAVLERQIHFYFMEVGVPVVCAFGLVGNLLNLLVLTKEKIHRSLTKMEKSAHLGLIGLAVSDFMFCLLALLFTLMPSQSNYTEQNAILYYEWLGSSLITVFIITSTWLIVVMAGERYLAVCHPFKARKIISLKKTKITIFLVYMLCMIFSIPLFFENILKKTKCVDNTVLYEITARKEYGRDMIALRRMIWALLFDFIPCAALLYFNACLIYKIHRAKKLRKQMVNGHDGNRCRFNSTTTSVTTPTSDPDLYSTVSSKTRSRLIKPKRKQSDNALNSVTATLVAVVVLFLILVSPSEVLKFIYTKVTNETHGKNYTLLMIKHVTNFMQALNFSVNFVLYCAVNKSFRKTLKNLFCFCDHHSTHYHRSHNDVKLGNMVPLFKNNVS